MLLPQAHRGQPVLGSTPCGQVWAGSVGLLGRWPLVSTLGGRLPLSSWTQPVLVSAYALAPSAAGHGSPGITSRARQTGQQPPMRCVYPCPHAGHACPVTEPAAVRWCPTWAQDGA